MNPTDPTPVPPMPDPVPPGPVAAPCVYVLVRMVGAGWEWVDGYAYQDRDAADAAAGAAEGVQVVALPLRP